jgi:hypothetical protein
LGACGSADVEALVAANFSAVKLDNPKCGAGSDMQAYYDLVHRTSPRPVVIENCHYNTTFPHWVDRPGGVLACPMSLFRVSNDIKANWASVMANVHATLPYAHPDHPISSPGCWSYPGRCTVDSAGLDQQRQAFLLLMVVGQPMWSMPLTLAGHT